MAHGATIGIAYYIFFNIQNNLTVKTTTTDWSPVGIFIIPFQVSPISDVNKFNNTLHPTKASNNNVPWDSDILNLQSTEDIVQDKAEL